MIRELIEAWRTPATPAARRLGYLYETIAFRERYRRCRESWKSHLRKCHEVIDKATANRGGNLMILGSGPLFEIPLAELTKRFERVILVDLVHPRPVRAQWGSCGKVLLIEQDLLGICDELMAWRPGASLPTPRPPDWSYLHPDFVISANCLSQLALMPRQRLESLPPHLPADELNEYCERLSAAHLQQVAALNASHLIIADFETRVKSRSGEILEKARPYFDPQALDMHDQWIWNIAPRGELDRRNHVEMSVGAFTLAT